MSRTLWKDRNPNFQKPDGTPLYDRRTKVKIWRAKLTSEFFPPPRKPTPSESVKLSAAVVLIIDLFDADPSGGFSGGGASQSLPKNYLKKLRVLERILKGFKPKTSRGKKTPAKESLGLAALLGDE